MSETQTDDGQGSDLTAEQKRIAKNSTLVPADEGKHDQDCAYFRDSGKITVFEDGHYEVRSLETLIDEGNVHEGPAALFGIAKAIYREHFGEVRD